MSSGTRSSTSSPEPEPGRAQDSSTVAVGSRDSSDGLYSIDDQQLRAFTSIINSMFKGSPLVDRTDSLLPVSDGSPEAFSESFKDGRLLTALVNQAKPGSIDVEPQMKQLRRGARTPSGRLASLLARKNTEAAATLRAALDASRSVEGVSMVNVHATAFAEGQPKILLGLVSQLVGACLMEQLSVRFHPEVMRLMTEGEELRAFHSLDHSGVLLRWLNWHLVEAAMTAGAGAQKVTNLGNALKDCHVYNKLLARLGPGLAPAEHKDPCARAKRMLENVKALGVPDVYVHAGDIANGNARTNEVLLAQIFNHCSGLAPLSDSELHLLQTIAQREGLDTMCADLHEFKLRRNEELLQASDTPFPEGLVALAHLDTSDFGSAQTPRSATWLSPSPPMSSRMLSDIGASGLSDGLHFLKQAELRRAEAASKEAAGTLEGHSPLEGRSPHHDRGGSDAPASTVGLPCLEKSSSRFMGRDAVIDKGEVDPYNMREGSGGGLYCLFCAMPDLACWRNDDK